MPDFSSDFGKRAEERLRKEIVAWLTTVGGDGTPQPSPVWFLWDGESILIYSQPDTPKVRNITRYPRIALHLDSDGRGGNIVILTGQAIIDRNAPPTNQNPAYLAKYGEEIIGIGMTPESFAAGYSVAIRFTPTKLRGN
jgi:PPOX class probable F420-dependent enzyme